MIFVCETAVSVIATAVVNIIDIVAVAPLTVFLIVYLTLCLLGGILGEEEGFCTIVFELTERDGKE